MGKIKHSLGEATLMCKIIWEVLRLRKGMPEEEGWPGSFWKWLWVLLVLELQNVGVPEDDLNSLESEIKMARR